MSISRTLTFAVSATVLAGCAGSTPPAPIDIAKVFTVKSSFGPEYKVATAGPTGIDPRLLGPQQLPPGINYQPPDCAKTGMAQGLPQGLKGNMAAVTAEGVGIRYIAIAVETSERVPFDSAATDQCKKVAFGGPGLRGAVDVVEAPHIDDAQTVGTHRVIITKSGAGEIYNYVAYLDDYLVLVTANPLVLPDQPVAKVDTARARDLLTTAVSAVRG